MKYTPIAVYGLFLSAAFFSSRLGYLGDLIASFRYQWLMLSLLPALLVFFYHRHLGAMLFITSFTLIAVHLNWFSDLTVAAKGSAKLSVRQINLSYYNPHIVEQMSHLALQNWDVLIVQEFNDNNKALFETIKPKFYRFGSDDRVGFPMGLGVISRYPLLSSKVVYAYTQRVGYIELDLLVTDKIIKLFAIHPPSPRSYKDWKLRNELLQTIHVLTQKLDGFWFISGDFNTVPWSDYFHYSRKSLCSNALANYQTWQHLKGFPLMLTGLPIDNCVVSQNMAVSGLKIEEFVGSDHHLLSYDVSF
ncbi:endonuclease/exonuclease/phosphatase family protein [Pseudoalteromonas sp. S16_S37]|uniref:endonuclease/exonuclease/phosphatase family protein n=1 Tax=Pseudoalteromonas sp. S16_S37 TaxID=2720228 RepID=UPI001681A41D|nr:endonuclease/exonuclease/phosphatase family protein [Pseudoalteromonas sp. S16_S37]MBD1582141.1 endonuclease/exonuclease/phosphatase family protein [Pseudoalteromonas sp. S16_S37]